MSPFTRNAAIAAGLALIPALAAVALNPERTRALPHRIAARARDIFEDDDSVESQVRRLGHRLNALTHDLEGRLPAARDIPTGRIAAIAAGLLVIPAALGVLFGTRQGAELREKMSDAWHGDETWDDHNASVQREIDGLSERLNDLDSNLQTQRDDAFEAVTRAAHKDD